VAKRHERFIAEQISLYALRMRCACLLEAEYIRAQLHPRVTEERGGYLETFASVHPENVAIDPGARERLSGDAVARIFHGFMGS